MIGLVLARFRAEIDWKGLLKDQPIYFNNNIDNEFIWFNFIILASLVYEKEEVIDWDTFPVNNFVLTGTVLVNNSLLTGTGPVNNLNVIYFMH